MQLSAIADQYPEQFTEEVTEAIQKIFTERSTVTNQMADRMGADLNGALGMVKDNQHWLSMTGGFDHRAPQLPELRLPSEAMSQEFQMPEPKSI